MPDQQYLTLQPKTLAVAKNLLRSCRKEITRLTRLLEDRNSIVEAHGRKIGDLHNEVNKWRNQAIAASERDENATNAMVASREAEQAVSKIVSSLEAKIDELERELYDERSIRKNSATASYEARLEKDAAADLAVRLVRALGEGVAGR